MSIKTMYGTPGEFEAVLGDQEQVKDMLVEKGVFGEFLKNYVTVRNEHEQADQAEAARGGGRRLNMAADAAPGAAPDRNPLAFSASAMAAVQAGIDSRTAQRIGAQMTPDELRVFNAALTTTTFGAPREWGWSVLNGPRILHKVAGVVTIPTDAAEGEHPKLALPTATAASAEAGSLTEYAASTAGSVILGRFGRFTDITVEGLLGTNANPIIQMHQLGVSKDLDSSLIGKVETDAGTAVAFNDPPADIRVAIAELVDNTAAADPAAIVILTHPDDVHLLEDVAPVGGRSIAEAFQRFSGALVYPSAQVTTGFMTVANLSAGAVWFQARDTMTETDNDIKTGVRSVATSILGGYGTGTVGSYAIQVDVVTP